jgi:hypothetical protein
MENVMCMKSMVLGAALVTVAAQAVAAQQGEVLAVKVGSGPTYYGSVTETADSVFVELVTGGTVTLPRQQVRSIRPVRGELSNGEFWTQDVNETRLFFAPTARTLPRGEGYVSVYEFFLPFVGYGVTDRVTLAGGVLPFFSEGSPVVAYAAPKVQVMSRDVVQAAVGGLAFVSSDSEESVGIVYGVMSLGRSSDSSVSLGAGFGYAGSDLANKPVLMAGWERRTSRRTKLISENWVIPGGVAILSFGSRLIGERMSADLGLAMPIFDEGVFVFPLVNFVWNW